MPESKVLNMKLPAELYDKLKTTADKKNIAMAALVRLILTEYIEQNKKNN